MRKGVRVNRSGARAGIEIGCGTGQPARLLRAANYDVVVMTQFLEYVRWDLVALELIRPNRTAFGAVSGSREPGHVREFTRAEQVRERYGPFLRDLQVESIHFPHGRSAFLFQGVK